MIWLGKNNHPQEVWKGVVGYEELYEVSSLGRVRSLPRICRKLEGKVMKDYLYGGKMLKPYKDPRGYLSVRLYRNDKTKDKKVHRLVAEAFLPNTDKTLQINHKDENKANNSVDNLEWCTGTYNRNYGSGATRNKKRVAQYDADGNLLAVYSSRHEAGIAVGTAPENICEVAKGNRKKAKGFIWRNI